MSKKLYFEHLKNFITSEGYWSTEDCKAIAEDIINKTKAKAMLEIGFNIGYSASVWIESGIENLYIIDINYHKDTELALQAVNNRYPNTVEWLLTDSTSQIAKNWQIPSVDISFIDGGHSYSVCLSDSLLSIEKNADWLVYDDVIERHENGIWSVLEQLESEEKIELICSYKMPWIQDNESYIVLAKVIK